MTQLTSPHKLADLLSNDRMDVHVYSGTLSRDVDYVTIEAVKTTPAVEVVNIAAVRLKLQNPENFELAEVFYSAGYVCKERRMDASENPIKIQLLWPKIYNGDDGHGVITEHRFYIRRKEVERLYSWSDNRTEQIGNMYSTLSRQISSVKEYPDLCNLPDLNEKTLLDNLQRRFNNGDIYTYIGSILIAVNPFKFYPIYNPKYVKMYQNRHYSDLPPHIFAIADAAFYNMMQSKKNQCIVISGESGSGKTESTNLLLHHLTALSQKGIHASGVEQTILGAGPVLEAFGNAVTVHNSNSSRFGKFIQVNYKNNGMVHGAVVEKYLLEKSRIVSQVMDERNYHVFYYLLNGAPADLKTKLSLTSIEDYAYLQNQCVLLEEEGDQDEQHEFTRLQQSMDLVGFSPNIQHRIFSLLSAVLHLGNVEFKKKESRHDESVAVKNEEVVTIISQLLQVQESTLTEALIQKKTTAGDETVVINYKLEDAIAARDAMSKCLYGALFDWIVLKVNRALLTKRHSSEHEGNSIGILDIFGFEAFQTNSFEQFCINFANERLQYYFNQHIFKLEQEEYRREGIDWQNVDFIDNTGCLELFTQRTTGLFSLLDEECTLPGVSSERLLVKFNQCQRRNSYYSVPQMREMAFIIEHYAGNIKYQIEAFREKNTDLVRPDIVGVIKNSSLTFVRELVGIDPIAMMRWGMLRAAFRGMFAFRTAGKKRREQENLKSRSTNKRDRVESLAVRDPLGEIGNRRSPGRELIDRMEQADHISNFDERLLRRATKLLAKRSIKKEKRPSKFQDYKVLKRIASRSLSSDSRKTMKKTPATVAAQFQISLNKLMDTLDQANPFFVRCIKSNPNRAPCYFDVDLVMRQLRYTGMLATVKIRQCGYNYRFTFQEFKQMYSLLLPRGNKSTEADIRQFLRDVIFHSHNYQIGITKVFLREVEKTLLDDTLHRALMSRIIKLQRWMKTIVQRRTYLRLQTSAAIIQVCVRRFIAMKQLEDYRTEQKAACDIQRYWKGYAARRNYLHTLGAIILIQSWVRAWKHRKQYEVLVQNKRIHTRAMSRRSIVNSEIVARRNQIEAARDAGRPVTLVITPVPLPEENLHRSPGRSLDSLSSANSSYSGDTSNHENMSASSSTSSLRSLRAGSPDSLRRPVKRTDHIVVRRKRIEQITTTNLAAPLAKEELETSYPTHEVQRRLQEKLSDSEDVRTHPKFDQLSPDAIKKIEDALMKKQKETRAGSRRIKKEPDGDSSDVTSPDITSPTTTKTSPEFPHKQSDPLPIDGHKTQFTRKKKLSRKGSRKTTTNDVSGVTGAMPREPARENGGGGNWSVAGMSQWQYPADLVITSVTALRHLDEFITKKIKEFSKNKGKRDTVFDVVFKKALGAFHMDLKARSSTAQQEPNFGMKYHELMTRFESVLLAYAKTEGINASFPVTIGINAFRGFLDEFIKANRKNRDKWDEKNKTTNKRKRDKQKKETIDYMGHRYQQIQFNIHTVCESCSSRIWIMEKAVVCQACKFTAHSKCYKNVNQPCSTVHNNAFMVQSPGATSQVFGVPLVNLLSPGDHIPPFIERLITAIEVHGLYTVGVYRKCGSAAKVRSIQHDLDEDASSVDLTEYPVHSLTSVFKCLLRELPEPLLTYELYDDFLNSLEAETEKDRLQAIYGVVEQLPPPNHALFERLIFHLARIAQNEDSNKMNASSLAVVFAPCLLRSNANQTAQESLYQVSKQTMCIERIISEQLRKLQMTLADICTLDTAQDAAHKRLSKVKHIVRWTFRSRTGYQPTNEMASSDASDYDDTDIGPIPDDLDLDSVFEEERELRETIRRIEAERDELTNSLPLLEHVDLVGSDDDLINPDDSLSLVDMLANQCDVDMNEEVAVSFDLPVMSRELRHLTKRRVATLPKRPPSRFTKGALVVPPTPKVRKISSRSRHRRKKRVSSQMEIMV